MSYFIYIQTVFQSTWKGEIPYLDLEHTSTLLPESLVKAHLFGVQMGY